MMGESCKTILQRHASELSTDRLLELRANEEHAVKDKVFRAYGPFPSRSYVATARQRELARESIEIIDVELDKRNVR